MKSIVTCIIPIILILGWLCSGIYMVAPKETAVSVFWGKIDNPQVSPGLHYYYPRPFGKVFIVETTTIKSIPVGFRMIEHVQGVKPAPEQCEWLTGDTNVLRVQLLVQYIVSDPAKYLFASTNPNTLLRKAGESSVTQRVGQMPVEEALTSGWASLSTLIQEDMQNQLDLCESGLSISNIQRIAIEPPDEVREAFQDVTDARQDKSRLVTEAKSYREQILPRTRGEAEAIIAEAKAQSSWRIAMADGDVQQFLALLPEVEKSSDSIRVRLYREVMEKALPRLSKKIIVKSPDGTSSPIRLFLQERNISIE